jgi:membrane dipeptidase
VTPVEANVAAARAILKTTTAIDYCPLGEPCIATVRHLQTMRSALAAGHPVGWIQRLMLDDRLHELAETADVRATVEASWEASGVRATIVTLGGRELEPSLWEAMIRDAAYWHSRQRLGGIRICLQAADYLNLRQSGEFGVVLALQDSGVLGEDLSRLEVLWQFGLRVAQLTYNTRNSIGDGCKERADGGLSNMGRKVLSNLNEKGVIVDLSHCGERTTLEAIELSRSPVAITHSFCRSLYNHPRGKSDDVLKALQRNQGYFGVVAIPSFLENSDAATLDDFVAHVRHAADMLGPNHVGIGTDYGWITPDAPEELIDLSRRKFISLGFEQSDLSAFGKGLTGFTHWSEWPNLPAALLAGGFSEDEVRGFVGENWTNLLGRC